MEEHIANSDNFLWYIEEVVEFNDRYKFKGWVCSYIYEIDDLVIGENELNIEFQFRSDLIDFYPKIKGVSHGIDIEIKKEDIYHSIVYAKVGENKYELGNLLKWVTYYSGYNDYKKDIVVVENFYKNPDLVRNYAINNLNFNGSNYHKGKRSDTRFILSSTKEQLEYILGKKITNWNHSGYANGIFQYCTADQPIVYHVDSQAMAAIVFLTPDAPIDTGTCFFKSKYTGETSFSDFTRNNDLYFKSFTGPYNDDLNFYDSTLHEKIDEVGNVYNRLVIWDARKIHAATKYFGDSLNNARFFHLFFFDVE